MGLRSLQRDWEALARRDALGAIFTGTELARDLPAFFGTGEAEVATMMAELAAAGLPRGRDRALDFGCGVGRLTQALAGRFASVVGVDIAPEMVERARALNRHGPRCSYAVNTRADLGSFPSASFDLVLCRIVLQHMPPRFARAYLAEFVRLLAPGGVAVFQVPEARLVRGRHPVLSRLAPRGLRRLWARWKTEGRIGLVANAPEMEMHCLARSRVERAVRRAGGVVRAVAEDGACGPEYRSLRYWATRPQG